MTHICIWVLQYRDGAQSFLITQFGLSCFMWEDNQYKAHTFNFYLFPLPMLPGPSKRFMCDVSPQAFAMHERFCKRTVH